MNPELENKNTLTPNQPASYCGQNETKFAV